MKYFFTLVFVFISVYASNIQEIELKNIEISEIEDFQAKKSMQKWLDGGFGLKPYRINYLLPYGYRKDVYKSFVPTDKYKNYEAELQVSLKYNIVNDLFGLDERYYLSYSHKAFWQVYAYSSPFRETIYNPEAFVVFPISGDNSIFNIISMKLALAHKSNGQGSDEDSIYKIPSNNPNNRSRSINYLYSEFAFQHETLVTELTLWARIPEDIEYDDNPDIMDYTGFMSIKFNYFIYKNKFTLMTRGSLKTRKGALELGYSYPLIDDVYFYAKFFSGYGESLIDYNNNINKLSVGFSFSR